jgi:hypothetical protein
MNIAQTRINDTIEMLQNALGKCENVDYSDSAKCDSTPAYALGWTTSTLKNALYDLKSAQKILDEVML